MSLLRNLNALKFTSILLAGTVAFAPVMAQKDCRNQYPCGDCAVYDNNGNDLSGFIKAYKNQMEASGTKVLEASQDQWGYMLVRTANVPSVSSKWETKGRLNYAAYIRATLVMNKTKTGAQSSWWGRECNLDNGPLVQVKANDEDKTGLDFLRYDKMMGNMEPKKITMVEYLDTFNMRDYDYLLKNHIVAKLGAIHHDDYKDVVSFYNGFLGKFSYTDDPVLTKMSFITFFKGTSNRQYIAYFNVVNSKLSGSLAALDIQYERDRDTVVKHTFKKLTGKTVYIYGDDSFGLDKTIIVYAKKNDLKLRRRKTDVTTRFNDER